MKMEHTTPNLIAKAKSFCTSVGGDPRVKELVTDLLLVMNSLEKDLKRSQELEEIRRGQILELINTDLLNDR